MMIFIYLYYSSLDKTEHRPLEKSEKGAAPSLIAIFASGRGSNAEKIITFFKDDPSVKIGLILSNRKEAKVLDLAQAHQIPTYIAAREDFYHSDKITTTLAKHKIDLIVLAGFLWLIPAYLVSAYPNKIINIHPALLPKYGGKGMYGMNVHKAVHKAGENETGITIHYVNERYDDGAVIFQAACELEKSDSPEQIAKKVLALEHQYLPQVLKELL